MNENDGSDGFAGVLPGGMRGRGNHRGQASQKNLKDQKVQSDQSASSGSLAGRVLNGLSSVSEARGGADGGDAGADVVTGSVAATPTETVNSVSDADVANNVLPESKTGRHAPRPGQRHWKKQAGPAFLTAKAIQVKAQHPMPKLFDRSERTDREHRTGMNECRLRNRP